MPQPRHIYASSLTRRQRRWGRPRRRELPWLSVVVAATAAVAVGAELVRGLLA